MTSTEVPQTPARKNEKERPRLTEEEKKQLLANLDIEGMSVSVVVLLKSSIGVLVQCRIGNVNSERRSPKCCKTSRIIMKDVYYVSRSWYAGLLWLSSPTSTTGISMRAYAGYNVKDRVESQILTRNQRRGSGRTHMMPLDLEMLNPHELISRVRALSSCL